jgi:hypothetical protein
MAAFEQLSLPSHSTARYQCMHLSAIRTGGQGPLHAPVCCWYGPCSKLDSRLLKQHSRLRALGGQKLAAPQQCKRLALQDVCRAVAIATIWCCGLSSMSLLAFCLCRCDISWASMGPTIVTSAPPHWHTTLCLWREKSYACVDLEQRCVYTCATSARAGS